MNESVKCALGATCIMCVNVVVVIFCIIIIIIIIIRTGRRRRWIGRACASVCREVWTTGALLLRSAAPRSLGTVSVCRRSRAAAAAAARPTDDLRAWPASIQMVLVRRSATTAALPRDEIQNILGRRRRPSCLHRRRFFHILSAIVYCDRRSVASSHPPPPLHRHPPRRRRNGI
uniref:Uncharacterized protein n=1 Tax=Schizaphis graminum TaxID=13262 RepID=A0A2S2NT01_SCHGA